MRRIMLIIVILSLFLAACESGGDGADDYHVINSPPVREHKEFAALVGVVFLLFLALRGRTMKVFRT